MKKFENRESDLEFRALKIFFDLFRVICVSAASQYANTLPNGSWDTVGEYYLHATALLPPPVFSVKNIPVEYEEHRRLAR